jgi:cytochrome oxidase Cu insertion factor (SCO1/SenC/PrrC family)
MMSFTRKTRACFILMVFGGLIILAPSGPPYAAEDPLTAGGIIQGRGKMVAPVFELENLNGKKFKLEDFRGNIVLIDFWTTW